MRDYLFSFSRKAHRPTTSHGTKGLSPSPHVFSSLLLCLIKLSSTSSSSHSLSLSSPLFFLFFFFPLQIFYKIDMCWRHICLRAEPHHRLERLNLWNSLSTSSSGHQGIIFSPPHSRILFLQTPFRIKIFSFSLSKIPRWVSASSWCCSVGTWCNSIWSFDF